MYQIYIHRNGNPYRRIPCERDMEFLRPLKRAVESLTAKHVIWTSSYLAQGPKTIYTPVEISCLLHEACHAITSSDPFCIDLGLDPTDPLSCQADEELAVGLQQRIERTLPRLGDDPFEWPLSALDFTPEGFDDFTPRYEPRYSWYVPPLRNAIFACYRR